MPYLGNFTAPAAWSPDGRHLLYNAGQPHVLDTTSGKSWPLLEGGPRLNWSGDASWSPDDRFLTMWIPRIREEWRHWQGVTPEAIAKLVR